MVLFAEFGMPKEDAVPPDGQAEVPERRFTRTLSVDPHFCPGQRVQRQDPVRRVDGQRRHLAGADLHNPPAR